MGRGKELERDFDSAKGKAVGSFAGSRGKEMSYYW